MSEIREEIKKEIVQYAKIMDAKGMVSSLEGNLSIYDRDNDLLYITPSSTRKSFLDESKIAVMNMENGKQIDGVLKRSGEYPLHMAALNSRPECRAVVHVHTPYLTAYAFCCREIKLNCSTTFALLFGEIPCLPYGEPGTKHIADGIKDALAEHDLILLGNHGVVAVGKDLEYAVSLVEAAEETLKIYSLANQVGKVRDISPECLAELCDNHPVSRKNRYRKEEK